MKTHLITACTFKIKFVRCGNEIKLTEIGYQVFEFKLGHARITFAKQIT